MLANGRIKLRLLRPQAPKVQGVVEEVNVR